MQNDGCCMDNCPTHCITNDVESAKQSLNNQNNNNNGLSDDSRVKIDKAASRIQDDYNNNINPNLQRYGFI